MRRTRVIIVLYRDYLVIGEEGEKEREEQGIGGEEKGVVLASHPLVHMTRDFPFW